MNHGGTPQASREPIIEPADVPTMTSACAGSHRVCSTNADSEPASHAPPSPPPAPRTSPTRGRSLPAPTTRTAPDCHADASPADVHTHQLRVAGRLAAHHA